jgi:preprotein translocase subunit SecB
MSENATTETKPSQPQFAIQKLYVKDASLEVPAAPQVFQGPWKPKVQLDVNTSASKIGEDLHEVVLRLVVTASQEEKSQLLIEVSQAGIFLCRGMAPEQLRTVLGTLCPDALFPYARECVDNMAVRAGFPPFGLAPMNFEALFRHAMEQQQAQAQKH